MQMNKKYFIKQVNATKEIITNLFDGKTRYIHTDSADYYKYKKLLGITRKRNWTRDNKNMALESAYRRLFSSEIEANGGDAKQFLIEEIPVDANQKPTSAPVGEVDKAALKVALTNLIKFFSEFGFSPSMRFVNTMINVEKPESFIYNYFKIQDHSYADEIRDKMKSPEFKTMMETLKTGKTENVVNTRLKMYFGAPGTGKTTKALTETTKCIVCSSDMLPTDLMQNFAFSDGKAEFQKSDLWVAMENGETIVLDEINMLPFESLRFLQGITDNKEVLNFKGFEIKIKDGFNIIGTMNLAVNGQVISIPEPLVDRCSEITEFELTAEALMNAM